MRAKITVHAGKQFVLTLEPENPAEKKDLIEMSEALKRANIINCRGFKYLEPEVEFLVQPYRGDE